MQQKLFYEQPTLTQFLATVIEIIEFDNNNIGLILDKTAFYPESGGQLADNGYINDHLVTDVQEKNEQIVHVIAGKGNFDDLFIAAKVQGKVNWQRRFDHMQQHSGQHLLSAVLYNTFQIETIGFHMGSDSSQIDIKTAEVTADLISSLETLANEQVFFNRAIQTKWLAAEEIATVPVRKIPPKEFTSARLVYIEDFEYSLCCGTHVAATGEIGVIKIRNWERKNNAIRLDFVCGQRALRDYQQKNALTNCLAALFSSPSAQLEETIKQALRKSEQQAKALVTAKQEFYQLLAKQLNAAAVCHCHTIRIITYIAEEASLQELTMLSKELLKVPQTIVLLAAPHSIDNKTNFSFATNVELPMLHMGQTIKKLVTGNGGKGGGSATTAQGSCSLLVNLPLVVAQIKDDIIQRLSDSTADSIC